MTEQKKPKGKIFAVLQYILFLGIGGGLFYFALKGIDYEELKSNLASADYSWFVLAMLCMMLSHLLRALRWKQLLAASGHDAPVGKIYGALLVGYGFNNLVPRSGEIARCTMLNRVSKVPFSTGFGTVITERVSDFIFLVILFCGLLLMEFEKIGEIWQSLGSQSSGTPGTETSSRTKILIGFMIVVLIGILVFLLFLKQVKEMAVFKKAIEFINGLKDSAKSIFRLKHPFLFILYSVLIWFLYLLMTYLPMLAFKETAGLGLYFSFIVLVIGGIGFIFPSPGGTGSYHLAVIETFNVFRGMRAAGQVYAIVAHAFQFFFTLLVGLVAYLILVSGRKN
jgi:uncharacterized membrane protein YbhN (UPF0104 family)